MRESLKYEHYNISFNFALTGSEFHALGAATCKHLSALRTSWRSCQVVLTTFINTEPNLGISSVETHGY